MKNKLRRPTSRNNEVAKVKVSIIDKERLAPLSKAPLKKIVAQLLQQKGVLCSEVIIHFLTKEKISDLHERYFDDPSPTDCISFPIDPPFTPTPHSILGEVFVCPEVALEYAKSHKKDPKQELLLYIVHGLLHLLGYDDIKSKERARMRKEEKRCMQAIGTI